MSALPSVYMIISHAPSWALSLSLSLDKNSPELPIGCLGGNNQLSILLGISNVDNNQ
jgi:hypothetical protein